MIHLNFLAVALAALIPLIVGFLWYNKKVFGTAWLKVSGVTPESGKGMNMALVFILTYVFSFLMAFALLSITIHQLGAMSSMVGEQGFGQEGSDVYNYFTDFMTRYGNNFRTFKHGALHGTIAGITIALPIMAINAMFERKGFKYIMINAGYWIVSMALMGGVVCAFA